MFRAPALIAALLLLAPQQVLQSGAISGTVVDGSTGAPIADAIVTLMPQAGTKLSPEFPVRQVVDTKGRFVFLNAPSEGTFQLAATKFGYLDGGYGRDTAPSDALRSIAIANGSWAGGLRVPLWPPAVISGTVVDETGEPVVGVLVRALARIRVAGRDELAAGPPTETDDHGSYRLGGLMPGRYIVQVPSVQASVAADTRIASASSNVPEGALDVDDTARLIIGRYPLPPRSANGRAMAYPSAFHPNTTAANQATTVDVRYGDDRAGIDIALTPMPAVRVSGTVEGPAEELTTLTVRLLPAGMENLGLGAETATSRVSPDGSFVFLNVPAGSYVIDAPVTFNEFSFRGGPTMTGGSVGGNSVSLPPPPPQHMTSRTSQETMAAPGISLSTSDFRAVTGGAPRPKFSGRSTVIVAGSDVTGVVVRLRPSVTVKGTIKLDADVPKPAAPPRFFVSLDPAGGQPAAGQPRANGSTVPDQDFEISGVQPTAYFLRVQGAPGWVVKSVQRNGREYATVPVDFGSAEEGPFVVMMTNAAPTLFGKVRNSDGTVPETAMVVVFPAQPAMRVNTGLWSPRLVSMPIAADAAFKFAELPAGDYFVAAIDRSHAVTWRDPAVLALVERQASRVTLSWGQGAAQDLTMMVIR
jgi:hypothetical protein